MNPSRKRKWTEMQIWGSHGSSYRDSCLLGCDTLQSGGYGDSVDQDWALSKPSGRGEAEHVTSAGFKGPMLVTLLSFLPFWLVFPWACLHLSCPYMHIWFPQHVSSTYTADGDGRLLWNVSKSLPHCFIMYLKITMHITMKLKCA